MLRVVVPGGPPAAGLLGQRVVVVEPDRVDRQQPGGQVAEPWRERHGAHQRVVDPHLLQGKETTGGRVTVRGPQQLLQPVRQPQHHRRRQHAGELDEGVAGKGLDHLVGQGVRRGERAGDLLVRGRLDVGSGRPGDQLRRLAVRAGRTTLLGGEGDVPVPPLLVVAGPLGADAGTAVGWWEQRVHSHSRATSWAKV